jgi:hypothetical protein
MPVPQARILMAKRWGLERGSRVITQQETFSGILLFPFPLNLDTPAKRLGSYALDSKDVGW